LSADEFLGRLYGLRPRLRVTPALIAINVAVFIAMLAAGAGFLTPHPAVHLAWGANFGPATKEDGWWRLGAAMFLHFGVVHLAFNMWALAESGRLVERLYGAASFLALYLFAGLTGSFASLLWNDDKLISAGASGAVFGVYGALLAYLVAEHGAVPVAPLKRVGMSAAVFVGFVMLYGAMQPGVDNASHVGGLLGGLAAGFALSRPLLPGAKLGGVRCLGAALAAPVALVALWAVLPPAAYSYRVQQKAERAINAFGVDEKRLNEDGRRLFAAWKKDEMDKALVADRIDRQLVKPWDRAYRDLAAIELPEAAPDGRQLALLKRYAATRRDMFALFAEGLRDGDNAKLRQADDRADELGRLLVELKRVRASAKKR
jgi:rhomboid protease GluP